MNRKALVKTVWVALAIFFFLHALGKLKVLNFETVAPLFGFSQNLESLLFQTYFSWLVLLAIVVVLALVERGFPKKAPALKKAIKFETIARLAFGWFYVFMDIIIALLLAIILIALYSNKPQELPGFVPFFGYLTLCVFCLDKAFDLNDKYIGPLLSKDYPKFKKQLEKEERKWGSSKQ